MPHVKSLAGMRESEKSRVHALLRESTHQDHVLLNQHSLLKGLMQPRYSLAAYIDLLHRYLQAYTLVETRIEQFLAGHGGLFDYTGRYKLPWLKSDIECLSHPDLPACNLAFDGIVYPEFESVGEFIGALYVVEGSTLGGRVISRSLMNYHGLSGDAGARFFNGYGEETSMLWQDFLRFAETIQHDHDECLNAARVATTTFALFNRVMKPVASVCMQGDSSK